MVVLELRAALLVQLYFVAVVVAVPVVLVLVLVVLEAVLQVFWLV
jgi:hypothetical protein